MQQYWGEKPANRRERKRIKDRMRLEKKQHPAYGTMVWCDICQMYTDTSVPYGTCLCS